MAEPAQEGEGKALSFELAREDLEVLEKIGSGHTSEVFRGFCSGEEVAIKQLSMRKVNTRNFSREVGIMSQIQHPNIVKLRGIVLASMPFQVIMEYCAGGTCFELLHNRLDIDLSWSQMLRMCRHCAIAMDYLHNFSPQIIHRDLKSLNLMLDQPVNSSEDVPLVKVTDFGLARMLEYKESVQLTTGVGTPYWMAPEVFQGNSYNEKIDTYSYGMVLFEIICRKIPFEEVEPTQVRQLVLNGNIPQLDSLPPDSPEELGNLMRVCWATDPARRPEFAAIVQVLRSLEDLKVVVSL